MDLSVQSQPQATCIRGLIELSILFNNLLVYFQQVHTSLYSTRMCDKTIDQEYCIDQSHYILEWYWWYIELFCRNMPAPYKLR